MANSAGGHAAAAAAASVTADSAGGHKAAAAAAAAATAAASVMAVSAGGGRTCACGGRWLQHGSQGFIRDTRLPAGCLNAARHLGEGLLALRHQHRYTLVHDLYSCAVTLLPMRGQGTVAERDNRNRMDQPCIPNGRY